MRIAIIARALRSIADELDGPKRKPPFVIEEAPPGTEPPEPFKPYGEYDDAVNTTLAKIYLRQALRRYSPNDKPAHA